MAAMSAIDRRGRRPLRRGAAVMLLAAQTLLGGCGSDQPAEGWFPLAAGHRWSYRVSSEWENGSTDREELVLHTLGEETLDGEGLSGRAWRRRSESGVDYWLRSDAGGIYRVASKSDVQAEPQADKPPRFVLKAPIAVGTSWQAGTTAYLLRRRSEFPPEIRHSHPSVPMTYVIEALDESVSTPAGAFEHCLRVKGQGSVRLFADPVVGWQDMPLRTLEWYCRGVGLVRVERSEPANSTFLLGGTQKLELTSWQ
ncbi:MAG: hypothetical protein RJA44_2367 [Pseudomonadota bacterium]